MRFAGGPFNNYVLHATAQLVKRIRRSPASRYGLLSSVSGVLTKHGFSLWGTRPQEPYQLLDVTTEAAATAGSRRNVIDCYYGPGVIDGYTVLHQNDRPTRAAAVIDTPVGDRVLAATGDERVTHAMEQQEFARPY